MVVVPGHGGRGRRGQAGGVGAGLANRSSLRAAPAAADPLPEQTAGTDRNTSLRSPSSSSSSSAAAAAAAAASLLPAPPRHCAGAASGTACAQPQRRPAAPSPRSRTAHALWQCRRRGPARPLLGGHRCGGSRPWGLGKVSCCRGRTERSRGWRRSPAVARDGLAPSTSSPAVCGEEKTGARGPWERG